VKTLKAEEPLGLGKRVDIPPDFLSLLSCLTSKLVDDFKSGNEPGGKGKGGVYWHRSKKWTPPGKFVYLMDSVRDTVQKHQTSLIKSMYGDDCPNVEDLELIAVSIRYHNTKYKGAFHIEEAWTCPAMLVILVLDCDGDYYLYLRRKSQAENVEVEEVEEDEEDEDAELPKIKLTKGQAYALFGEALTEWEHRPKVELPSGRAILVLGYDWKKDVERKSKELSKVGVDDQPSAHKVYPFMLKKEYIMEKIIGRKPWEGQKGQGSMVLERAVGDQVVYFAGPYKIYREIDIIKHFSCASEMIRFVGHKNLLPNSVDDDAALMTYAALYNSCTTITIERAREWDRSVRLSLIPFVAWHDRQVEDWALSPAAKAVLGDAERLKYILPFAKEKMDWVAAVRAESKASGSRTRQHLKDILSAAKQSPDKFFGEWKMTQTETTKMLKKLSKAKVMDFSPDGFLENDDLLTTVFLDTLCLQSQLSAAREAAVKVYEEASSGSGSKLAVWSHSTKGANYGRKAYFKVKLPDGCKQTHSKAFSHYHGIIDDMPAAEQAKRGPDMFVPDAPPDIQAIFDTCLVSMASKHHDYENVADFVNGEYDGVMYHITLNFLGGHTYTHVDEFSHDGTGQYICNVALQKAGLLCFIDPKTGNMTVLWQQPGDAVTFSGPARLSWLHAVLRELPIASLPPPPMSPGQDIKWAKDIRIVLTIRMGDLAPEEEKEWYSAWATDYDIQNPFAPTKIKAEPEEGNKLDAPDPLPAIGSLFGEATYGNWGPSEVVKRTTNFVHVRDLNRSGKKSDIPPMEKGMLFQMKLPVNDKPKTTKYDLFTFEVHEVGIIMSPTGDVSKTKYRALIVSHKINSGAWSKELHTLNASGIQSANSVNLLHLPSKLLISLPIKLPYEGDIEGIYLVRGWNRNYYGRASGPVVLTVGQWTRSYYGLDP
jgi:hypothetical protein